MALNDDPKKKPYKSALAAPNVAAPAMGALPAVANWAMNRPEQKGFEPVMPDYTKPNPTNKPIMLANVPKPAAPGANATQARASASSPAPAVARPDFSNVRTGFKTLQSPTQPPASTPTGAGASTADGGAAPNRATMRPDGVAVVRQSNGVNAYGANGRSVANAQGTIGSVNQQNFGNPVVPQAQASIARPGVASTFGLGVNDPRLDSQIARPPVQLGPNQTAGGGTLASPSSMGRYYANKEDREATQKLLGDIDTQMFMARGKNTPSARRLMEGLASAKAQAIGNMAANTTEQANENTRGEFGLANTGMEQAGATQRQQMAGDVAREGNLLDFNAKNRATDASLIERPSFVTDADGRYLRVGANGAAPVTDAAGNTIQMPQTQQAQITPDAILKSLDLQEKAITDQLFSAPPEAAASLQERLKSVSAQREQLLRGGGQPQQAKPPAGYPNAKQAPDGKWYVQKDGATYRVN